MAAGLQDPETPFVELTGRLGAVEFWQSGPSWVNAGTTGGITVMLMVVVLAHCPELDVKV